MDPKTDKLSRQRDEIYEKFKDAMEHIDLGVPLGENITFMKLLNDLEAVDEAYFVDRFGPPKDHAPR